MADPIHGIIQFDRKNTSHRLLLDVINSKAFQRLRRIKQMGLAEFVFPGATHSRFAHSLGCAHLMIKTLEHFYRIRNTRELLKSNYKNTKIPLERLLLLSILIHDIGHTPLSHTLEDVLGLEEKGLQHDHYWNHRIIKEDPELLKIWNKYDPELPDAMLDFLGETGGEKHFLAVLVSSQLDMDRLDYLLRDSHFLGVQYGQIEDQRIISNLMMAKRSEDDSDMVIAVREESVPAIEHYLFGRHQAYKMALHPLDKASESLLMILLRRFAWVREQGIDSGDPAEELYQLMVNGRELSVQQYLFLDDCYLWQAINRWAIYSKDELLKSIANRMLQHDLLKFVDMRKYKHVGSIFDLPDIIEPLKAFYEEKGLSFEFGFQEVYVQPKPLYKVRKGKEPIWVRTQRGRLFDLSEVSTLSLDVMPEQGIKHLIFVWDKHVKQFLQNLLEEKYPPELTVEEEVPPDIEADEDEETII